MSNIPHPFQRAASTAASTRHLAYRIHQQDVAILAYADDLVLVSKSPEGLQQLLDSSSIMATKLGLRFKPAKCASLSLDCRSHPPILPGAFTIQGNAIQALTEEQHYRYLGVTIGLYRAGDDLPGLADKMVDDLRRVESSLIAPWQKLDAYRTFIQPFIQPTAYLPTRLLSDGSPMQIPPAGDATKPRKPSHTC